VYLVPLEGRRFVFGTIFCSRQLKQYIFGDLETWLSFKKEHFRVVALFYGSLFRD
jgi:hypothetical protein